MTVPVCEIYRKFGVNERNVARKLPGQQSKGDGGKPGADQGDQLCCKEVAKGPVGKNVQHGWGLS